MKAPRPQSNYEPIASGSYPARCYSIIEIGTIQPKNPSFNPAKKIRISWELPTVIEEYTDESGKKTEQPRKIVSEFTFSMHKRAKLRQTIESWFGKSFPSEESAYDFEIEKLIGRTCLLAVQQDEGSDGEIYSNVSGILPLPKEMPCPGSVNSPFFLCYEQWDQEAFDSLSEKTKAKMMTTPEYKSLNTNNNVNNLPGVEEIDIEDLPF